MDSKRLLLFQCRYKTNGKRQLSYGRTWEVCPPFVLKESTASTILLAVDKSTDHAKPHSICFLPQYQRQSPAKEDIVF